MLQARERREEESRARTEREREAIGAADSEGEKEGKKERAGRAAVVVGEKEGVCASALGVGLDLAGGA